LNIAFRVDASQKIGIGHLMRCLALSEELTRRGNCCYFLSKLDGSELSEMIGERDANYVKINSDITLREDLELLIGFSREEDIDWIITDSYDMDSNYIQLIKKTGTNVLSFDDTAQIHYYSDIVLNQNVGAEKLDFSAEKYTKFLLGPKFAILRDGLLKRESGIKKTTAEKILVTMGGADPDNLTLKILRILRTVNENVEVLVVVGPLNRFYKDLKTYTKETDSKVNLIKSSEKMTEVYLKSDLAISAGGTSCYELAYFGIPNIIITIADNQINIAKELDKQKISKYLGQMNEISAEKLKETIKELINNQTLRKIMSQNGRNIVDGAGKKRTVDFMESLN
jgi:UDP-2,4-diacetamido-2,4,6-trideoxy-beta-L-altropyranose hydrolase